MQEMNEKLDRILSSLEEIANELKAARRETKKMSEHIDTVDYYVNVFDQHFRPWNKQVTLQATQTIEDSLD